MKITYIFRTQSQQRSIERVFEPIIGIMKAEGHDVNVEFAKRGRGLLSSLWKNMWHFRKVSQARICHITGDVQYVACLMNPKNTILTIHDLVPLHNKKVPWYSKFLCYWLWYYIPLKRLNHITCISEATRQDLISFFPWVKEKITVIPDPVDPHFKYSPKDFNLDYPRILHIGTKSNKNLLRVIEALGGIKCHLRIIGKLNDEYLNALQVHNIDYSNEYGISDEQIVEEYKQSDIVSFPSLFEGFGMPIIEGQAVGRIVVTSNIEPMKSVAGDSAIFVTPENVDSIKAGFLEAFMALKNPMDIITGSIANSQKYSREQITNSYNKLYRNISDKSCLHT